MNFGQNGLTGQTKLLAHKWYELGWRYDAGRGEMSVLVDGMAEKIVAGRPSLQRSGPLMLGADPPFTGIPGVVDDLRIYNLPLTGAELVVLQQMDAGSRAASPDAPTSARVLPMTVSIGCIPSETTIPRSYFEEAIRHYADAVYEMTEGLHRLGRVEIYTNKARWGRANLWWECEAGRANAHIGGYLFADSGFRTQMFHDPSAEISGYTAAHEAGHLVYALFDEYREVGGTWTAPSMPQERDTPVAYSIMNNQYRATDTTSYVCVEWYPWWQFWNRGRCVRWEERVQGGDLRWLNLSTRANETRNTAQFRMYAASGWGTLVRPPTQDPRQGAANGTYREWDANYPEFVGYNINLNALPPLQLPAARPAARSALQIVWVQGDGNRVSASGEEESAVNGVVRQYLVDTSAGMTAKRLEVVKTILSQQLDSAREGDVFGLLNFDGNVRERLPLTLINASNRDAIQAAIAALTLGEAEVATGDALFEAYSRLTAEAYLDTARAVYLIGTGAATTGRQPAAMTASFAEAGISVYSFGYNASADDGYILRELADATWGFYTDVEDAQSLLAGLQVADRYTSLTFYSGVKTGYQPLEAGAQYSTDIYVDAGLNLLQATVWFGATPAEFPLEMVAPDGGTATFPVGQCEEWGTPEAPFTSCVIGLDASPGVWQLRGVNNRGADAWIWYFVDGWAQTGVQTYGASVTNTAGDIVQYPRPIVLNARVYQALDITDATLVGEVNAPDGSYQVFSMSDDGVAPDTTARDGNYAGYVDYWSDGDYWITVQFDNDSGEAAYTNLGVTDQITVEITTIGENFHRYGQTWIRVVDWQADDHANELEDAATLLPPDNTYIPGRIDDAGDVDAFMVNPGEMGVTNIQELFLRVDTLGLQMDPYVFIYDQDLNILHEEYFEYNPDSNDYLFVPLTMVTPSEVFYVSVEHYFDEMDTGTYEISVGPRLLGDPMPETGISFLNDEAEPYRDIPYPVVPGGVVTFTHTFTHTGVAADNFIFTAKSWEGWPLTLHVQNQRVSGMSEIMLNLPSVAAGATFTYHLGVGVPTATEKGTLADIYLTVEAQTAAWLHTSQINKIGVGDIRQELYLPVINR
jgi:hypothetical protein